jgi:hypothetical protein
MASASVKIRSNSADCDFVAARRERPERANHSGARFRFGEHRHIATDSFQCRTQSIPWSCPPLSPPSILADL